MPHECDARKINMTAEDGIAARVQGLEMLDGAEDESAEPLIPV
jgi:hypothetical protein